MFSKTSGREICEGVGAKAPLQGDMSYLEIGGKRKRLGEIEKLLTTRKQRCIKQKSEEI